MTRAAATTLIEALGRAHEALRRGYGDLERRPGSMLAMERALVRLRGSARFHNLDTILGLLPAYSSSALSFAQDDRVGLGLEEGTLVAERGTAAAFSPFSPWTPDSGPPCPEGWAPEYGAWAAWPVAGATEDGHYATRSTKLTPVRYVGGGVYAQVGYWERGRVVSFLNDSGAARSTNVAVSVALSDDELEGLQIRKPSGEPIDLRAYSHGALFQTRASGAWSALGAVGQLDPLAIAWSSPSPGVWTLTLNLPPSYSWAPGAYWHVVLYWGSKDPFAVRGGAPAPAYAPQASVAAAPTLWTRKSFFRKELRTAVARENEGVNVGGVFLRALDRTHFDFYDAQFSTPAVPDRYAVGDVPANADAQIPRSLSAYVGDVARGHCVPVTIVARTSGQPYEGPSADLSVLVGPAVAPEGAPADWGRSPLFPAPPHGYVGLARAVLARAPGESYGVAESRSFVSLGDFAGAPSNPFEPITWLARAAIAWMSVDVPPYALPPLGSEALASVVLPNLASATARARGYLASDPTVRAAFRTVPAAIGEPATLTTDQQAMARPQSDASQAFRELVKAPEDDDLLPDEGALALSDAASSLLCDVAGLPPSTELARLDADRLWATGRTLPMATVLELWMEPSDQCTRVDPDSAGTGLGLDYTLRLSLEDASENLFHKDWYVMASSYVLSDGEYASRVALGQSTAGWFKASTLPNIPEYARFGAAGVVPNLKMGDAQALAMRQELITTTDDDGNQTVSLGPDAYPNAFVAVRSVALCAAKYASYDLSYWTNNLFSYFGYPQSELATGESAAASFRDARADSFTIAPAGLPIGALEGHGSQAAFVSDAGLTFVGGATDRFVLDGAVAARLVPTVSQPVTGLRLRLRLSGATADSPSGVGLVASLYSEADGLPDAPLARGGRVDFAALPHGAYADVAFPLAYGFRAGTPVWLVVAPDAPPLSGLAALGFASESDATPSALQQTAEGWSTTGGAAYATASGPGGTTLAAPFDPASAPTFDEVLAFPRFAARMTLTAATDALCVRLRADAALTNPPSDALSFAVYSSVGGAPGAKVADAGAVAYRALGPAYADFALAPSATLPSGVYWLVATLGPRPAGGRVCVQKTGAPAGAAARLVGGAWVPDFGVPSLSFFAAPARTLAAFNRDTDDVAASLPPPFAERGYVAAGKPSATYRVESWCAFSADPIDPPAALAVYPRAFNDGGVWRYANFSQDAYVIARLVVNGRVEDAWLTVPKAPAWRCRYWTKDAVSYRDITEEAAPTIQSSVAEIDLLNLDSGLGTYWNGVIEGAYIPLFSKAYVIVAQGQGGYRVYVDGTLAIDNWLQPIDAETTFTTPPLDSQTEVSIRVEHYRAGGAESLTLQWRTLDAVGADGLGVQPLGFLSDLSAKAASPAPIPIGSGPASGVVYLAVGKTSDEVDTYTHGAPEGDRLVLRSA